jgi:hypothetical protein
MARAFLVVLSDVSKVSEESDDDENNDSTLQNGGRDVHTFKRRPLPAASIQARVESSTFFRFAFVQGRQVTPTPSLRSSTVVEGLDGGTLSFAGTSQEYRTKTRGGQGAFALHGG